MEYRRLGRTGLKVAPVCLGTMQFGWTTDEPTAHRIMSEAVSLGCNFFDSADIYSRWVDGNEGGVSESIIGTWLASSAVVRDDVVIATKVRGSMGAGPNSQGLSRKHIFTAVEASLRRLQTDYIDLYQVHWPDEETPLDETLTALNDLVTSGKVRYLGCSNYPAWLLMKALWRSDVAGLARYESLQPHYNLVHRAEFERELAALCLDQAIAVIPYSPLAGGFLTGKYRRDTQLPASARAERIRSRYMNDRGFAAIEALDALAQAHDATVPQMALAWLLSKPAVTSAIIGANTVGQLRDTVRGATFALSETQVESLDNVTSWL